MIYLFVPVNLFMPFLLHFKTMWVLYLYWFWFVFDFVVLLGYIHTFLSSCCHIWDDLEGKEVCELLGLLSFGVINTGILKKWLASFLVFLYLSKSPIGILRNLFLECRPTFSVFGGSHLFLVTHKVILEVQKGLGWKGPSGSHGSHIPPRGRDATQ